MSQQLDLFAQAVERGENDGDVQTVKLATYHDLKAAARVCGCITCAGVLENIKNAVLERASVYVSKKMEVQKNRWARENRCYFIQRLWEALASPTVKHNFKKES